MRLAIVVIAALIGGTASAQHLPKTESAFLLAIGNARATYDAQPDALKKSKVLAGMVDAWKEAMPDARFHGWTGTIAEIGTNADGKTHLAIKLSSMVTILTWNDAQSDSIAHSLILPRSELATALKDLKVGDRVRCDGELRTFKDPVERDRVFDTSMIVVFSAIEGADVRSD
jgi:ribosomal protein L21E